MNIKEMDKTYVANTYNRFPLEIVRGQGSLVEDEAGRTYIDLGSGIAVTSFGVADEAWRQAVTRQLGRVQHMSNLYYTAPCAELAKMLCEATGFKKVFFSNSGAESNECAIKACRKYAAEKHGPDCYTIVTLKNSFHGRTGELYAYMHYGIQPDIVSTAKGLAGGLPLGATLLGEKVENVFGYGDHGSTFGGNPIACAGAISVLSRLDAALLSEVRAKSAFLFDTFAGAPGVEAVTGLGLMIGIKTTKPAAQVVKACMENGVLCLTAKDKVRLLPALNIPMELLEKAAEIIKAACAES